MKKAATLCLLAATITLTGCIEIIQELKINEDKSGSISYRLNMGALKKMLGQADKYIDQTVMEDIKQMPGACQGRLNDCKGLSNVQSKSSANQGDYGVSFDFKNGRHLNHALYELFDQKKNGIKPALVKITDHKVKLKNLAPYIRLLVNMEEKRIKDAGVLKFITFKSVVELPRPVIRHSNRKATVSRDGRMVVYQCTLDELLNEKADIGNRIKY